MHSQIFYPSKHFLHTVWSLLFTDPGLFPLVSLLSPYYMYLPLFTTVRWSEFPSQKCDAGHCSLFNIYQLGNLNKQVNITISKNQVLQILDLVLRPLYLVSSLFIVYKIYNDSFIQKYTWDKLSESLERP